MRLLSEWRFRLVGILTMGTCLLDSSHAWARRQLEVRVYSDDKVVLQTAYEDAGTEDTATVWGYLKQKPVSASKEHTSIKADEGKPLQATLKGNIRVAINHADKVLAEAKATELKLIRAEPTDDKWYLPPEEVERMTPKAVIATVTMDNSSTRKGIMIGTIGVVAVVLCYGFWRYSSRRNQVNPPA